MNHTIPKLLALLALLANLASAADPLASWNDGPAKQGIVNFVEKVTWEGSPNLAPGSIRANRLGERWGGERVDAVLGLVQV